MPRGRSVLTLANCLYNATHTLPQDIRGSMKREQDRLDMADGLPTAMSLQWDWHWTTRTPVHLGERTASQIGGYRSTAGERSGGRCSRKTCRKSSAPAKPPIPRRGNRQFRQQLPASIELFPGLASTRRKPFQRMYHTRCTGATSQRSSMRPGCSTTAQGSRATLGDTEHWAKLSGLRA